MAEYKAGSPEQVAFKDSLQSFLNIYAKAINPTGRLTDTQQNHAYETLNTAMSQGQIETGVNQLLAELGYMKSGIGEAVGTVDELLRGGTGASPSGASQPATTSSVPTDLPSASGHPDGYVARDASGKVVAKVVDGKWVAP
jgi:hypothetical protein